MKHIFEIGSDLLCFEPDETKEKLIYHARVINHNGFETKGKIKVALYLVHFLGWSKKWDRVVSENLLLPLSEFNITLKEKIDLIAKTEKRHQLRHDLIDEVLEAASKVTNESKFNWNDLEKKLETISLQFKHEKKSEITKGSSMGDESESVNKSLTEVGDFTPDIENSQLQKENDFIHVTFSPKISLSDKQLDLLALDKSLNSKLVYDKICSIDDLDKYAWNPCLVDILQRYVDAFPVLESRIPPWKEFERFFDMDHEGFLDRIENSPTSILDLSFDFNERSSSKKQFKLPQWPDSELNIDYQRADLSGQLCFEICTGLRILFDFYGRHLLMYENEQVHCQTIDAVIGATDDFCPTSMKLGSGETTVSKLLPEEYRHHRYGFQPSIFFGYPHLLRLLHKLPTILARMGLTRCSLAVVLRHSYSLIQFLNTTFTGASSITYQPIVAPTIKNNHMKHKRKRSPPPHSNNVKTEPRILLRRLDTISKYDSHLETTTHHANFMQQESRGILTRSQSKLKK